MKKSGLQRLLVVLFALAVCVPSLTGQQAAFPPTVSSQARAAADAPDSCAHLFTSGSNSTFLQYCVSDNGNISSIQTPFQHPHSGGGGEGYGLCQESPAVEYHDYAVSNSGNWAAAQVLSATNSAIKISRSTNDGNWTLVQTITKVGLTSSIKVVMALTNNQSVAKVAYLLRFADVDANGNSSNWFVPGFEGVVGWDQVSAGPGPNYGLQLQNAGKTPFGYQQGFARAANYGPNACDFAANSLGLIEYYDGSLAYVYAGPVPAQQTMTVTLSYRGL